MAQIHILNAETIDKIAAGEVVERPGSVVKELVENAIDAGATAITVEAKEGGIEFIRVTDNGCGMEKDQLRQAFLRHATSKIEDAEDLARISSLGFRGEALSSIAAVSKVEVITKTSADLTGSRILLEGAREVAFDEIGAPEGTTFLMRSLFFNTPVRRKFLKQPATEGGYIADLMEHLALSRPDISFKLVLGGQMKFHTSGNGDLREVIYRIYGREVANELVPVGGEQEGIRIEGYLGKPVLVRSNRNFEIYFMNGRFIRSNIVSKAVEEGYREYLMQHKFPLCVLHISMDPEQVDVNVHPTKMDVRFSDPICFSRFLMDTVQATLRRQEMIPRATLSTRQEEKAEKKAQIEASQKLAVPEPFEQKRNVSYQVMEAASYVPRQPEKRAFADTPVWNRIKKNVSANSPKAEVSVLPESAAPEEEEDFFEETSELPEDLEEKEAGDQELPACQDSLSEGFPVMETLAVADALPAKCQDPKTFKTNRDTTEEINETAAPVTGVQLNLFEEKILTRENRSRFRVIGQVFETYWLIEFEEKLLMIDQHAAHEKVNYERLMKQYHEKRVLSQGLLPPVIVSLSGQEESVLREHLDTFAALGFEIEAFGGSEYALRSVPVDLYGCNEREMFLEVLDGLLGGVNFGSIRVIEEKIASMSCKAAVKGNNKLSFAEAEALVDELLTLENPYNCPHGRPTIITMTKTEMERKFKRIVS
ncbi:MAG: DNA mismatch repair endonuclease MutL [Lachnospiraceae bacterium]|jgi:DNA mismatch repair protein MutL|nr:DNA mismatch repair endonuclease MutL [Lachnospiraceae bacterium]